MKNIEMLDPLFLFEPIKGYPRLNWKGKRPFTATQYYPAQLKEQHGDVVNGWLNKIFWGDNLQVMSHLLREFRGKIDLIYIDPPFDSKADYKKNIKLKGDSFESDQSAFEEKQYQDIWANDDYLQFMYERLILLKELLSAKGSIFLHCDWHKAHYLRAIMDEVFGESNFRNEIIWTYYGPGSPGMKNFNRKHDNIFWYSKTQKWIFNADKIRIPHDSKTLDNFKDGLRGSGFIAGDYEIPEGKIPESHWMFAIAGRYPLDGVKRVGYPTEKPLPLIERIINACAEKDSIVFDCFMGAGTTQVAAMKLGHRFIGADINLGAIQTTTKRLYKVSEELKKTQPMLGEDQILYTGFEVYNVNHYDVFRNPVQAKELLIQALDIQPIPNSIYDGEKDSRMVKIMPVNHIATKADVADLIHGVDYNAFEKRKDEKPNQPVEKITLICMGHEPDLAAFVQQSIGYKLDIEVVDILRDRSDLQFKRDSEALFKVENGQLVVDKFYPMNLLQKLSQNKDTVSDWREMVESIMIDWNYDGAVFQPTLTDIPAKNELVQGQYAIPEDAGTIRIKITDLLSESLERDMTEEELANG
ncbi:site-specific DNA-methyltransferase [Acinetobacter indicus]|uniref:site-specific DNA-methyltransferase n=1 Tax=Acinetobacter indicus TaxID=756892 RepID=UPI00144492E8|nr:site-specific DNA-methyltransferase [Acinetobacter indicus]